ncbi:MAG: glycosyltransferase family 4 protein [Vicinamibacteria bacterium]
MDILHVVHGYFPALGGAETLIQGISEQLASRHGDRVLVLTPNGYNTEAFVDPRQPLLPVGEREIDGVTVRRLPVTNRFAPALFHLQRAAYHLRLPGNDRLRTWYGGPIVPGLARAIESFRGDLVAAASFPLLHMYTTLDACRRSGKPLVFIGAIHPLDDWGYQRPMIYRAIRSADAYIALSSYERDYLVERCRVPEDKVTVVGVGIDPAPFELADGSEIRRRHEMGERPLVGFIGQQTAHKGIDALFLAMKLVWQERPETRLLVAGARTNVTPKLQAFFRERLNPRERARVTYLHNFSESEKPELFAACDIFAYPSWYESFGIAFLEAWSAGKPVVGARAGAVPAVVDEDQDGLLVTPRDPISLATALLRLLESGELRRRLGEAGRKKVETRYRWEVVSRKWREVYERVLSKGSGSCKSL